MFFEHDILPLKHKQLYVIFKIWNDFDRIYQNLLKSLILISYW